MFGQGPEVAVTAYDFGMIENDDLAAIARNASRSLRVQQVVAYVDISAFVDRAESSVDEASNDKKRGANEGQTMTGICLTSAA